MAQNICIYCNEYNGSFKLDDKIYCSNCYKYLKDGLWVIMPISLVKKNGYKTYINKKKINHLFKIISGYYDNMDLDNLNNLLQDTKITSQHCETLYNIFSKMDETKYNIKLEHILCSKVVNYWELKSSIGECYYSNYGEVPVDLDELETKLNKNEEIFDYFNLRIY